MVTKSGQKKLSGSAESGMVKIPTEFITENGKKLEGMVLELAHLQRPGRIVYGLVRK